MIWGVLMKDRETSSQQVEQEKLSSQQTMTQDTDTNKGYNNKDNVQFGTQLQCVRAWEIRSCWDVSHFPSQNPNKDSL